MYTFFFSQKLTAQEAFCEEPRHNSCKHLWCS